MVTKGRLLAAACMTLIPVVFAQPSADTKVAVDQGWSAEQKFTWYTLSQGSRLIPWDWLDALEQANSTEAFLAPANIEKFRYLAPVPGAGKALPLGFTIDDQSDKRFSEITKLQWKKGQGDRAEWVGMTCAACHTGELTYQSQRLRVDGAPTLADFQGFIRALNLALAATQANPDKWQRFAVKVLRTANDNVNRNMLAGAFTDLLEWQMRTQRANDTSLAYGYARLDAFGHIYNKVLLRVEANQQPLNPSDAPVSYPFLWNIHQHDFVQWNGSAPNKRFGDLDVGALGRNVGEVTGVFADLTLHQGGPEAVKGYPTSARVDNLITLERQLTTLKPPNWPAVFPPIDAAKWAAGETLYNKHCSKCHDLLPREDLKADIKARMSPLSGPKAIGTDPWMACNAYTYTGNTGLFGKGPLPTYKLFFPQNFFLWLSPKHGQTDAVSDLLGTVVVGSIWDRRLDVVDNLGKLEEYLKSLKSFDLKQGAEDLAKMKAAAETPGFDSVTGMKLDKAARLALCMKAEPKAVGYKGRPLTGVWATAPYLHNGSVPTLYDLLLPPEKRPTRFGLGTREFDPKKVGFANEHASAPEFTERAKAENTFVFKVVGDDGKPIAGNSNAGHDYDNSALTDTERWALVEYMKAVAGTRNGNTVVP